MSILLSAYYPDGIVFAADRNATITSIPSGATHVEPTATKVLAWPSKKAVVGFVGLGDLASLPLDEWMRIFIAGTRGFADIDDLARTLQTKIQTDFDADYPPSTDLADNHLVVHLGGFASRSGIITPVMYHIWNHPGIDPQSGYRPAHRVFQLSEDIERDFNSNQDPARYPMDVRAWLLAKMKAGEYQWYNNGANLAAFNTFKSVIWSSLDALQQAGFAPSASGVVHEVSFCKMAVEVFGSFFTHYYPPPERAVGGGVDEEHIAWPA